MFDLRSRVFVQRFVVSEYLTQSIVADMAFDSLDGRVQEIMEPIKVVSPELNMMQLGELFADISESIVGVVDNHCRPLGVMYRSRVNELFGMRLGRELFEKKPVSQFMDKDFYQFEHQTLLTDVASEMTDHGDSEYLTQHFLIVQQGILLGVGTARKLLKVINHERIKRAIHSNPLTTLPGQVPLSELQAKLRGEEMPYAVVYFDLDHFKVFNDQYGHRRGDEAILLLANVLRDCSDRDHLPFHIGGDDFEVVVLADNAVAWASQIKRRYEQQVVSLYDQVHREANCIVGLDRYGQSRRFPLMTVATAVILPEYTDKCAQQVSSWTAVAKKCAKRSGEVCVFEQELVNQCL